MYKIAILQVALMDLGYEMPRSTQANGPPEGIYGSETKSVVTAFQTHEKLQGIDGLAGRETLARLDAIMSAAYPVKKTKPAPAAPAPPASRDYRVGTGDPTIHPDPGAGAWDSTPITITALVQRHLILSILPPRGVSAAVVTATMPPGTRFTT